MKKFFSVFVFVFLSVVGVYGQQIDETVGLPIGSSFLRGGVVVYNIFISDGDRGWWIEAPPFTYDGEVNGLDAAITSRLQKLADTLVPPLGFEKDIYHLGADVKRSSNGDFVANYSPYPGFRLEKQGDRWVVPPKVLEVKLNYGGSVDWYVDGVAVVEMEIVTSKGVEHFSSEYGGAGASPCYIGALQNSLKRGAVYIESSYALPSLQKETGVLPGSTLTLREKDRDHFATFNLLDGTLIKASDPVPAFLPSLRVTNPVIPLRVVGIYPRKVDVPVDGDNSHRVTRIWWTVVVDGKTGSSIVLEFSENLRDWQTMTPAFGGEAFRMPHTLTRRHMEFTHDTVLPHCFYRVRLAEQASAKP